MANISIPERYQAGVSKIRELHLDTVRDIRTALDATVLRRNSSPESPAPSDTAAEAAMSVVSRSGSAADLMQIADAVSSLYSVKSNRDVSVDDLVAGVADALEELPDPDLRMSPSERDSFVEKLTILLNADVFALTTKIADLRTENERIFCHARILTDMRPVFGKNVEDGAVAMLLTHNLKVAFHAAGRKGDHEIFVSMDSDDLEELRKVIDRAQAKAKSLKSASNVRIVGLRD